MTTIGRARRGGVRVAIIAAALGACSFATPATAQPVPTEPTTTKSTEIVPLENSAYAGTELRRSRAPQGGTATEGTADAEKVPPSTGFGLGRVLLSLGVVVGIIFGLKYFGQRWFVPGAVKGSNRTVETLSRTILSPRQQVLLIRVGRRRVLVVADSGGKLSPLDQITDPDEIAELTAQLRSEKAGPASTAFAGVFGKTAEKFEAETEANEAKEQVDSSVAATQSDLAGLLEKVRGVSSRLGR